MTSRQSKLQGDQAPQRSLLVHDGWRKRYRGEQAGVTVVSSQFGDARSSSEYGEQPSREVMKRTGVAAGLRVVVVEDEFLISILIEDLLTDMGAEVVGTALSADQAIRLAETMSPDCMTMDINIQGDRDGVSAAIEIHERFGIRSVFVSAYGNPETMARAQPADPVAWVSKPISKEKLEAAMSAVPR